MARINNQALECYLAILRLYRESQSKKVYEGKIYAHLNFNDIKNSLPVERGTRSVRNYLRILVLEGFLKIAPLNEDPFDRSSWYLPLKQSWKLKDDSDE